MQAAAGGDEGMLWEWGEGMLEELEILLGELGNNTHRTTPPSSKLFPTSTIVQTSLLSKHEGQFLAGPWYP